jgi:hypothetical protein
MAAVSDKDKQAWWERFLASFSRSRTRVGAVVPTARSASTRPRSPSAFKKFVDEHLAIAKQHLDNFKKAFGYDEPRDANKSKVRIAAEVVLTAAALLSFIGFMAWVGMAGLLFVGLGNPMSMLVGIVLFGVAGAGILFGSSLLALDARKIISGAFDGGGNAINLKYADLKTQYAQSKAADCNPFSAGMRALFNAIVRPLGSSIAVLGGGNSTGLPTASSLPPGERGRPVSPGQQRLLFAALGVGSMDPAEKMEADPEVDDSDAEQDSGGEEIYYNVDSGYGSEDGEDGILMMPIPGDDAGDVVDGYDSPGLT